MTKHRCMVRQLERRSWWLVCTRWDCDYMEMGIRTWHRALGMAILHHEGRIP